MKTTVFTGNFSNLDKIGDFFTAAAEEAGLDEKSTSDVQLAVDEAASNIIEHSYGGQNQGNIECSYDVHPDKLIIVIKDYGKPFDPELVAHPDLKSDPCEREIRGLGLHFMRSLMDTLEFTFNGRGGNVLTMVKQRAKSTNPS
jgi:serine/threonine-protein kinase RsbW